MNRRRLRALVALAVALLALPLAGLSPARSAVDRPHEVAQLRAVPPVNGSPTNAEISLALDPVRRRGYQLALSGNSTHITAFDLDSLEILASRTVSFAAFSLGAHGLDADGGRIFMAVGRPMFQGVAVLDEALFASGDPAAVRLLQAPQTPVYNAAIVAGVRYEPSIGKLLLLLNPQRTGDSVLGLTRAKTPYANFMAQWDATSGKEDWLHAITQCSTASINNEIGMSVTPFLSRDGKNIYAMCSSSETEMQMLRLGVPSPGAKPTEGQLYPAGSSIGTVMVDAAAERVHMISSSAYIVTFDWPTRRIVGTASISPLPTALPVAFGDVDQTTGRIIVASPPRGGGSANQAGDPGGLLLVDGRRATLPQALIYDDLVKTQVFRVAPVIDPAGSGRPRRVFVRHSTKDNPNEAEPFFRVYADPVPVSVDAAAGELDPTLDIDESDKTQSSFAGEANGYGSRVLMVGGIQGPVNLQETTGKCGPTNRDILFGSVQRAALSVVAASVRADGADADLSTQADLRDLSRCGNGGNVLVRYPAWPEQAKGQGPGWTYVPAECSGVDEKGTGPGQWTAKATCRQDEGVVQGEAQHLQGGGAAAGGISIGRSTSSTKVHRDATLGIVSTTTSVAEDIVIPGVGAIGSVKSVAMSRANGRVPKPGDPARTAWTVEICGTTIGQTKDEACQTGPEAADTIARLNEVGRNRIMFRQPAVDKDLIQGSPGGYVAGIQRDRGEAALSRLENSDELMTVPGLEIIVRTNPDSTPKRYIVQLAGVRAVSTYGISKLPENTMPTGEAENIVEELGLEVNAGAGFGAGGPIAPAPAPSLIQQIVETVGDAVERVYRTAFMFDFRNPGDVALALGVWLTFGTPLYLAERRRRYRGMLL